MQEIVEALAAQHAELDAALAPLADEDWARDSRCPGWTVADVVLHLAQTDELAAANTRGETGTDDWAGGDVDAVVDAAVARERGAPPAELLARWRAASAAVREALAAADPRAPVPWAVGTLPARTLATTRLAECWIHTGDVLYALRVRQEPTDRLWHIARLAWRTLPYAFVKDGREPAGGFGVKLRAPDGSTWEFGLDDDPATIVRGDALGFCLVAARRTTPERVDLSATGPDCDRVLDVVRTFA
jgi:uncharacterized protein (TIGR03084 family)